MGRCGAVAPWRGRAAGSRSRGRGWRPRSANAAGTGSRVATRSPGSPNRPGTRGFAGTLQLHEQLLAEARAHGEPRHTVWALEGIAQIHRHNGDHETALALFVEACAIAEDADDQRGRAWALRGIADLASLRDDPERALELLADAEATCRDMRLNSALAYNHKMRGNVFYRAGRYAEAERVHRDTIAEFTLAKCDARWAATSAATAEDSVAVDGHRRQKMTGPVRDARASAGECVLSWHRPGHSCRRLTGCLANRLRAMLPGTCRRRR